MNPRARLSSRNSFPVWVLAITAAGEALFLLRRDPGEGGVWLLWLWGILMGIRTLATPTPVRPAEIAGWLTLATAFVLSWVSIPWAIWFALLSLLVYRCGVVPGLRLAPALFLLSVLVPLHQYLSLLLSFPLSHLVAQLTTVLLQLTGIPAESSHAVIRFGSEAVAVTAACSGIEWLEAMLLAGWLVVIRTPIARWLRVIHFLLLIPILVFCNAVRLTVLLLLFRRFGDNMFAPLPYLSSGFAVMAATLLLLWWCGKLFPRKERHDVQPG